MTGVYLMLLRKHPAALFATIWFLPGVNTLVVSQLLAAHEPFGAEGAGKPKRGWGRPSRSQSASQSTNLRQNMPLCKRTNIPVTKNPPNIFNFLFPVCFSLNPKVFTEEFTLLNMVWFAYASYGIRTQDYWERQSSPLGQSNFLRGKKFETCHVVPKCFRAPSSTIGAGPQECLTVTLKSATTIIF